MCFLVCFFLVFHFFVCVVLYCFVFFARVSAVVLLSLGSFQKGFGSRMHQEIRGFGDCL